MLTERSPEECWSKQQGADSALPSQEALKREGAWSERDEEKVRWRGAGSVTWQQTRSNQHLQLAEKEEYSVFERDTSHLQWSSYLLAALIFFQAGRFSRSPLDVYGRKGLLITPLLARIHPTRISINLLAIKLLKYGFSSCGKRPVKPRSPKLWDSFIQHSSHATVLCTLFSDAHVLIHLKII